MDPTCRFDSESKNDIFKSKSYQDSHRKERNGLKSAMEYEQRLPVLTVQHCQDNEKPKAGRTSRVNKKRNAQSITEPENAKSRRSKALNEQPNETEGDVTGATSFPTKFRAASAL